MSEIKIERKLNNCANCIFCPKCPNYDKKKPLTDCADFKHKNKNIQIKVAPGDTVWFTKWYNVPDGEIVSRTIIYVSFHKDGTVYHCKDGAFNEDGFGVYAFRSLDAAKIISGIRADQGLN
jgi:hypothetical protein